MSTVHKLNNQLHSKFISFAVGGEGGKKDIKDILYFIIILLNTLAGSGERRSSSTLPGLDGDACPRLVFELLLGGLLPPLMTSSQSPA